MTLTKETTNLLNDILDYIQETESEDFEEQFNDLRVYPQNLVFQDDHELSGHIFNKACKLRYLLSK
jgi:hypothetical protein